MLISHRVNTFLLVLLVVMAGAIIAILASRSTAGPLDPPGPPSSTLPLVEPRTPIDHIPYVIGTPGSYYLTKTLYAAPGDPYGIEILSGAVTLDLNGFGLLGTGAASGASGISTPNVIGDVVVRNGLVSSWPGSGIHFSGPPIDVQRSAFEDLMLYGNGANGIQTGPSKIIRITSVGNGAYGIVVNASTGLSGCEIVDSYVSNVGLDGIFISSSGCSVHGNSVANATGNGLRIYAADSTLVFDNVIGHSGSCGVSSPGFGNTIRDNTVDANAGCGIKLNGTGDTVIHNIVQNNAGMGAIPFYNNNSVGPCTSGGPVGTWTNPFWNIC